MRRIRGEIIGKRKTENVSELEEYLQVYPASNKIVRNLKKIRLERFSFIFPAALECPPHFSRHSAR